MPLVRLLIPLTAGILLAQWINISINLIVVIAMMATVIFISYRFLTYNQKFQFRFLNGLSLNLIVLCLGISLIYFQNLENDPQWIGKYAAKTNLMMVTLLEPVSAKTKSYKALSKIQSVFVNGKWIHVKGNIIVYFSKDNSLLPLVYGSQLIIKKALQPIRNSGNPGGFDYKQYCAFQNIHFQVYLQKRDFLITGLVYKNILAEQLINTRNHVLSIIRKWVPGQIETGVAEALLIGYRDDLDKDLVRSYSNTGVVHIIAISGLHLGMIYGLILLLLKPFRNKKWLRIVKPLIILIVLWGFSFLAGALPSILRSAVMFSFIVIGESLGRRTNIYNTLAASAFCLLVFNPYFFWDVGFQLSYTAVLSILLFMKPIYQCFYFENKLLNVVWELNAVTLSAQVLTLPIILYYFHQFPNLFLFTNFIAVPLSGFILYAELLLLVFCKIPFLNAQIGKIISFLINQMNGVIERTDRIPFSVTDNIQVGLVQTLLLYLSICILAWWLMNKKPTSLIIGLCFLLVVFILRNNTLVGQLKQHKLIIFNIPKHNAMDIIEGNGFMFLGDSSLKGTGFLQNFHLQTARVHYGVRKKDSLSNSFFTYPFLVGNRMSVLFLGSNVHFRPISKKILVDIIVINGSPNFSITQLASMFDCNQYIFSNTNSLWKIRYWKKEADRLHLRHHTISEQGAYEVNL